MTLVAALFAAFAASSFAADAVKTDANPGAKPGRQIDDGAVKAGGATDKPGRAADEEKKPAKKKKKAKKPE
jgi:hypothetical protein